MYPPFSDSPVFGSRPVPHSGGSCFSPVSSFLLALRVPFFYFPFASQCDLRSVSVSCCRLPQQGYPAPWGLRGNAAVTFVQQKVLKDWLMLGVVKRDEEDWPPPILNVL